MKFGVCTGIENAAVLADAGYDYIELPLAPTAELASDEYAELKKRVADSPLVPEVFNIFLPKRISVTGDAVDWAEISEYVKVALGRAAELGAQLVGIGSGGSRRVPDGFPAERAMEQLRDLVRLAAEEGRARGLSVMIEPLRREETNIINSGAEGLSLLEIVDSPSALLELDYYHMASVGESAEIVIRAGKVRLGHCHIANPDGRRWPSDPKEAGYRDFFTALREIGYERRMSIEGRCDDIAAQAGPSLACLRRLADTE